jgi:hypothetical protein
MRTRTGNKLTAEEIPNIVFNFIDFFNINNLDIVGEGKTMANFELDLIQNKFVGFLSENKTFLYCRNIDPNDKFKFRKIPLQENPYGLLDYWKIPISRTSNTIVLSEGNFDILSEYAFDSLGIRDGVRLYASGNTFSYSSLLKSVCFNESLYNVDVIILSDSDKPAKWYTKFLKDNSHILKSCKIYMNKRGKDFGVFPPLPSQIL